LKTVRDPATAKDLVQDVFICLIERLASFDQNRDFRTWLGQIADYRAINYVNREANYRGRVLKNAFAGQDAATPKGHNPDDSLLDREQKARLSAALAELPELTRKCMIDHYGNDATIPDLCEIYGLSPGRAKYILRSGLRILQGKLKDLI
jgi:RNA polymerase sigma-70 factor (ECF subfamily)